MKKRVTGIFVSNKLTIEKSTPDNHVYVKFALRLCKPYENTNMKFA